MLDFSLSSLFAGLIFGTIGFWLIKQGRTKANFYWISLGMVMMVYSYFTHSPWADWGIGAALCGLAYYWRYE